MCSKIKEEMLKELKSALKNLDALYSTGIISQEEYSQKRQQMIERL